MQKNQKLVFNFREEAAAMNIQAFIFSNEILIRIIRHLLFWLAFSIHIILFRYYVPDLKYIGYASTYLIRLQNLLLFLPVSVFSAYLAIYFFLPRFILKGRYVLLTINILLLCILLLLISYFTSTIFNIRLGFDLPLNRASFIRQTDFTVSNGLVYPITVSGFAICIKMAKNFYLQQKENELLANQKIKAEVQLLKSQVHPRFLFHSLNTIYNDMLNGSEKSPAMLLKLSDLLSYILYESDERLVPLENELALLHNYIDLEKASRGNKLTINPGNDIITEEKLIAPLLLLPLAEFMFDQAENYTGKELILTMNILLKENTFWFIITMSGYSLPTVDTFNENIQLKQLYKRLQALYPGKHDLKTTIDKNAATISLSLILDNMQ